MNIYSVTIETTWEMDQFQKEKIMRRRAATMEFVVIILSVFQVQIAGIDERSSSLKSKTINLRWQCYISVQNWINPKVKTDMLGPLEFH
jgi:hypothetical protein